MQHDATSWCIDDDKFFDDYNAGCLDIEAFSKFQLKEFANKTYEEMRRSWRTASACR